MPDPKAGRSVGLNRAAKDQTETEKDVSLAVEDVNWAVKDVSQWAAKEVSRRAAKNRSVMEIGSERRWISG